MQWMPTRTKKSTSRYKLDGFLKAHGVMIDDYTIEDLRREVETLERLGF